MTQPVCECCQRQYGERLKITEHVFCPIDPEHPDTPPVAPPYQGNSNVVRENYSPTESAWTEGHRASGDTTGRVLYRELWNGE